MIRQAIAHTHAHTRAHTLSLGIIATKTKSHSVDSWLCFKRFYSVRMDDNTEHSVLLERDRTSLLFFRAAIGVREKCMVARVIFLFVEFRLDFYITETI